MGSVVTTEPVQPEAATESEIALVQLTGSGSGRSVRLGPGRYRIGPGRRLSADELIEAPVATAAFELTVDAADSAGAARAEDPGGAGRPATVAARRRGGAVGDPVGRPVPHRRKPRVSCSTCSPVAASRSVEAPDADGLIPFHRSPRRHPRTHRRPVIDAVADAALATAELWAQRSGRTAHFVVPIGMRSTDSRPTEVTLDLAGSPVVAVTGDDRFRTAMARTIIVELATLHGPADLDIAIIPGPEQTAVWEWAKWLPHIRLGGDPMIHRDRREVTDWAARLGQTTWDAGHLTVVVVDDPSQWTVPGSPLRELMAAAPEGLRVLALCEREREAPSESAVIISGSDVGSAHLEVLDRAAEHAGVPAVTDRGGHGPHRRPAPGAVARHRDAASFGSRSGRPTTGRPLPVPTTTGHGRGHWPRSTPRTDAVVGRRDPDTVEVGRSDHRCGRSP